MKAALQGWFALAAVVLCAACGPAVNHSQSVNSFTTSGTYTKVTQLIPVKIRLVENLNLADIIGTNATVKIRIK